MATKKKSDQGQTEPGNIDLFDRPSILNADGSRSSVRSMSINQNGIEILIPTIGPNGETLTPREAVRLFRDTGKHLGKFRTPEDATRASRQISDDFGAGKFDRKRETPTDRPGNPQRGLSPPTPTPTVPATETAKVALRAAETAFQSLEPGPAGTITSNPRWRQARAAVDRAATNLRRAQAENVRAVIGGATARVAKKTRRQEAFNPAISADQAAGLRAPAEPADTRTRLQKAQAGEVPPKQPSLLGLAKAGVSKFIGAVSGTEGGGIIGADFSRGATEGAGVIKSRQTGGRFPGAGAQLDVNVPTEFAGPEIDPATGASTLGGLAATGRAAPAAAAPAPAGQPGQPEQAAGEPSAAPTAPVGAAGAPEDIPEVGLGQQQPEAPAAAEHMPGPPVTDAHLSRAALSPEVAALKAAIDAPAPVFEGLGFNIPERLALGFLAGLRGNAHIQPIIDSRRRDARLTYDAALQSKALKIREAESLLTATQAQQSFDESQRRFGLEHGLRAESFDALQTFRENTLNQRGLLTREGHELQRELARESTKAIMARLKLNGPKMSGRQATDLGDMIAAKKGIRLLKQMVMEGNPNVQRFEDADIPGTPALFGFAIGSEQRRFKALWQALTAEIKTDLIGAAQTFQELKNISDFLVEFGSLNSKMINGVLAVENRLDRAMQGHILSMRAGNFQGVDLLETTAMSEGFFEASGFGGGGGRFQRSRDEIIPGVNFAPVPGDWEDDGLQLLEGGG